MAPLPRVFLMRIHSAKKAEIAENLSSPPGNTRDSHSNAIWNFQGLIMHKLSFITVNSIAQMMGLAIFETLYLRHF